MGDAMSRSRPIFEVRGLVKTYPGQVRPANDGIDLEIHEGDILGPPSP
jgi:hypothetical protein